MYTKEQASAIRARFWKVLGQYMAPQLSAEGTKVNWINYKTGIKHLHFKMEAGQQGALIAIEMSHPDGDIRKLMMAQFAELKQMLTRYLGEEWIWEPEYAAAEERIVSRICAKTEGLSIYRQEDWPGLISFFKPRLIALDQFWSSAQYGFDLFR